jgi:hypothetical protein
MRDYQNPKSNEIRSEIKLKSWYSGSGAKYHDGLAYWNLYLHVEMSNKPTS